MLDSVPTCVLFFFILVGHALTSVCHHYSWSWSGHIYAWCAYLFGDTPWRGHPSGQAEEGYWPSCATHHLVKMVVTWLLSGQTAVGAVCPGLSLT